MSNIEEHIRRAQEQGKFDDLPGKGKPIRWEENPHEDPEWHLAHSMLRQAGFSLPWIETLREIEDELASMRTALRRSWEWRRQALDENQRYDFVEGEWQKALDNFRQQLEALNKRIFNYNLEVPAPNFQRPQFKFEIEVEKIKRQG